MLREKSIKDAVHGYIVLEEPFWKIIDTSIFQRLKWIEQTSYRPLFPSARHDRFIHSIGVFHLGKQAINGFEKNAMDCDKDLINSKRNSFLLACLLHDIGHAPFSHTSEKMYNYKYKIDNYNSPLVQELLLCIKNHISDESYKDFASDYRKTILNKEAAEHEIMSCIITCKKFSELKEFFDEEDDLDIELIVRAIIGCCFSCTATEENEKDREKGIKNCLIRLLNSKTIDVDKLDYIARDTAMTGYDNIVIDTCRLLDGVTMICDNHVFRPAYRKSAMSVINNVVTAKSLQAKWIVNHPTIVYDSDILQNAMIQSLKKYAEKISEVGREIDGDTFIRTVFSSDALLDDGITINDVKVSLLSDIDILYMLKQNMDNPLVKEYFSRDMRKKPVWKSYEEFLYHLKASDEEDRKKKADEINSFFVPLQNYGETRALGERLEINNTLLKRIESESFDDEDNKKVLIDLIKALKEYDDDEDFEYVLLTVKNKFFPKELYKEVYIRFGNDEKDFSRLDSFDKGSKNTESELTYYYLYSNKKTDPTKMLEHLLSRSKECMKITV